MKTTSTKLLTILLLTSGLSLSPKVPDTQKKNLEKKSVKNFQKFTQRRGDLRVTVKTTRKKPLLKEYQPIHLTFTNTGNEAYTLKAENIGLQLLTKKDLEHIARKRFNVLPFTSIFSAQIFTVGMLIPGAGLAIGLPVVAIGTLLTTALDQFRIKKINKREKRVLKSLKRGIEIKPYSIRNVTLHIKKDYVKPRFDLTLVNSLSQAPIRYNINLLPEVKTPKIGKELGIKTGKDLGIYKK